jgi:hypothetical protein
VVQQHVTGAQCGEYVALPAVAGSQRRGDLGRERRRAQV